MTWSAYPARLLSFDDEVTLLEYLYSHDAPTIT